MMAPGSAGAPSPDLDDAQVEGRRPIIRGKLNDCEAEGIRWPSHSTSTGLPSAGCCTRTSTPPRPGGSEIPESVAPNIRNRSYSIAVEVTIDTEEAGGVLFAHGSRFGGHALYIKDGKLKCAYNFVSLDEQIVESTEPVPTGHVVLSASFEKEGDAMPTEGTVTLHMREAAGGEGKIKTQPGKFSIAGEGLNVGKEGAEPVTDMIDVSGKPFVDLAQEARMAFARD
jgi:arylsulfatase